MANAIPDNLAAYARGEISAQIAAMRLLIEANSVDEAQWAVDRAKPLLGDGAAAELSALLTPDAFTAVKSVAASIDHDDRSGEPGAALTRLAEAFDRAARLSPEAGVALYSLGDVELLRRATEEVVEQLRAWGLPGPGKSLVEVGCGIGRFLVALAPEFAEVVGADISPAMVEQTRARAAGLRNVRVLHTSGADLAFQPDLSSDVLLYADSFPYVVQAGGDLARRHITDAARVLRPGGRLLILNYSYRGDLELDAREFDELSSQAGLNVHRAAERPFRLWDGAVFLAEKPA